MVYLIYFSKDLSFQPLIFRKKTFCRMAKKPASTMKLWSFTCSNSAIWWKNLDGWKTSHRCGSRESQELRGQSSAKDGNILGHGSLICLRDSSISFFNICFFLWFFPENRIYLAIFEGEFWYWKIDMTSLSFVSLYEVIWVRRHILPMRQLWRIDFRLDFQPNVTCFDGKFAGRSQDSDPGIFAVTAVALARMGKPGVGNSAGNSWFHAVLLSGHKFDCNIDR